MSIMSTMTRISHAYTPTNHNKVVIFVPNLSCSCENELSTKVSTAAHRMSVSRHTPSGRGKFETQ